MCRPAPQHPAAPTAPHEAEEAGGAHQQLRLEQGQADLAGGHHLQERAGLPVKGAGGGAVAGAGMRPAAACCAV